ncbi:YUP8H12.26 protein [Rhodotorula toruloides]|nr:YUP8H12.26 protein [Rhodotorula toruloides]
MPLGHVDELETLTASIPDLPPSGSNVQPTYFEFLAGPHPVDSTVRASGLKNSLKAALDRFIARWDRPRFSSRLLVDTNRLGDHRLTLIGVTRAHEEDLRLTSAHTNEPKLVETLSADEDLAKLSGWVSGWVKTYFPSVYNRFAKADPGQVNPAHPFRCRYGIFPLLCLNYAPNSPVHCLEHVDYKNVAGGVCAVLACGDSDSTKSHDFVFHDLKKNRN